MRIGLTRGVALFLGGFSLLNVAGSVLDPNFDANIWWIDFRPLPGVIARPVLCLLSILVLAGAFLPRVRVLRVTARLAILVLIGVVLANCAVYYILLFKGEIHTDFPFPFSVGILIALILIFPSGPGAEPERPARGTVWIAFAVCVLVFPVSQILSFGRTDYRRRAEAIVVLGARTYADGTMSQALRDRTRTGVDLFLAGYAARLVFSGGPGDAAVHETEAMRRYATGRGVPATAITLDREGLNTRATVRNTLVFFRRNGIRRALVVSHYFHLPRIKMAYQQAGFDVRTVPARERTILYQTPYLLLRETAALWFYYFRPLFGMDAEET